MLIVVTGASRGIGFEMVKKFAEDTNHLVIAVSRNIKPLVDLVNKNNTHNLLPLQADISTAAGQKKIVKFLKELNLPLEVLINNAGAILNKPFAKIQKTELQTVYDTNVFSPFLLIQALLPFTNKKKKTHVVNIGSMGGFQGSSKFAGLSAYSSSKGALAVLTECLAEELKPLGISLNCLALGAVQTEMLNKAFPGYKANVGASKMAEYICEFALKGQGLYNGKVIPVSASTP